MTNTANKRVSNRAFLPDRLFNLCCIKANITPNVRQASKYRRKFGIAYSFLKAVKELIKKDRKEKKK